MRAYRVATYQGKGCAMNPVALAVLAMFAVFVAVAAIAVF